ncbi:PAS domain S-box protein [Halosimplex aquaticum]
MCRRADASGTAFWGEVDDTEARERYRALVDAIDGGIVRIDGEGRVAAVDDVLVDLTGREREDLLGRPVAALFDGDAPAIEREVDRLAAGEAGRSARADIALRTADGNRVPCEMRVNPIELDGTAGLVGVVRRDVGREAAEGATPRGSPAAEHPPTNASGTTRTRGAAGGERSTTSI